MNENFKRNKGFTLLEVMIVIAILGILVAIALPSYQSYILRSHRVDARNILQDISQKMQQFYSINRRYDTGVNLTSWGMNQSPASGDARYTIRFTTLTDTDYTLEAVPVGAQTADECGTFTLNQSGVKTAAGQNSRGGLSISCWRG